MAQNFRNEKGQNFRNRHHPDRKEIQADFAPLFDLISGRRERFGYYDEDVGEFFIPIDRPFIRKLAEMWETRRADFWEHEKAAFTKGRRAQARFLIERQKQARKLAHVAYAMRMSDDKWSEEALLFYYDLHAMLEEKGIAENTLDLIEGGRRSQEQIREIRRKFPDFFKATDEVSVPPQVCGADESPEPILTQYNGEIASAVLRVRNPIRVAIRIQVLWLTVGKRRWSRAICLRRMDDNKISRSIKLKPRSTVDVLLQFRFRESDCQGNEVEVWFASTNPLEYFSVHLKLPASAPAELAQLPQFEE
jgi:hypothetical protein